MARDQDRRIAEVVEREQSRLHRFIRGRVADSRDAEDILQDVLSELVEANRRLMPIEHLTGWLFRVARNRIIDLFRKKREESLDLELEELLPSPDAGPDAEFTRVVLLDELEAAIEELPREQRDVFIAHEVDGFGGGPRGMRHRWTPEEKARFRQRVHERWGRRPEAEPAGNP
jgi:RNA polymerase sigma factor (sigma-70 family)